MKKIIILTDYKDDIEMPIPYLIGLFLFLASICATLAYITVDGWHEQQRIKGVSQPAPPCPCQPPRAVQKH